MQKQNTVTKEDYIDPSKVVLDSSGVVPAGAVIDTPDYIDPAKVVLDSYGIVPAEVVIDNPDYIDPAKVELDDQGVIDTGNAAIGTMPVQPPGEKQSESRIKATIKNTVSAAKQGMTKAQGITSLPEEYLKRDDTALRAAGDTALAVPKVAGAVAGSLALMPGAGVRAAIDLIPTISPDPDKILEPGSLDKASKTFNEIMSVPGKLITTPEESKAVKNIGLATKPLEMAGKGWGMIGNAINAGLKELGLPADTYLEPLLSSYGEAAAVFALPEVVKTIKNSTIYRQMTIPERALVTQEVARWAKEGMSEAELLRKLGPDSQLWKDALKSRQNPPVNTSEINTASGPESIKPNGEVNITFQEQGNAIGARLKTDVPEKPPGSAISTEGGFMPAPFTDTVKTAEFNALPEAIEPAEVIVDKLPNNISTIQGTSQVQDIKPEDVIIDKVGSGALQDVENELAAEVDSNTTDPTLPSGSVNLSGLFGQAGKKSFTFSDPDIEIRFTKAKGAPQETMLSKAKETLTSLINKTTREFEHLPKTGEFAQLRFDLLKLQKQKAVATDKTLRNIQGITVKLDKDSYDLFTRKIVLNDLVETAKEGLDLPFGFDASKLKTEAALLDEEINNNQAVRQAIEKRKKTWDALKTEYITAMDSIGVDVADRFSRENYYRHQVLDRLRSEGLFGTGKRLKSPVNRSYLKERSGSELDINTDYIQAEHEVMAQMYYDMETARTIKNIKDKYSIAEKLKAKAGAMEKATGKGVDWRDLVPEGYEIWQPREGNVFYLADTIPAKLAEQLEAGLLQQLGITKEMLGKALAMGGKRAEFVIKHEVAETLNNLTRQRTENPIFKAHRGLVTKWKEWQLISPRRWGKYNLRNITGDLDAVIAGDPLIVQEVPKAVIDLYNVYAGNKAMSSDLKAWFERGGQGSNLQAQEMGELNDLAMFKKMIEQKKGISDLPAELWKKYWRIARLSTDYRESILRYAAYLRAMKLMKDQANGLPAEYWASKPGEIQGLSRMEDRAYWMSNDLLGAYDRISVAGQALRESIYPFWSFKEANLKRYFQMFNNAARSPKLAQQIGRTILGKAAKTPYIAYRVGIWAIRASAFWAGLQVWNWLMFPDEEDDLPESVRNKPHIVLGRNKDGTVNYFSRLGSLSDILENFGIDAMPYYVDQWMKGRKTIKDIAIEMAKSPVNIAIQGAEPVSKTIAELLARRAFYPDAFKPKTIRDRMLHVATGLGLENEYKAVAGLPSRGYGKSLKNLFAYSIDPLEAAYSDAYELKRQYFKKQGKVTDGFFLTPKGNALYNMKMSLRYQDKFAFNKYIKEYVTLYISEGGDPSKIDKNIERSLEAMSPLYGMSDAEIMGFVAQLDSDERKTVGKALVFYEELTGLQDKWMNE